MAAHFLRQEICLVGERENLWPQNFEHSRSLASSFFSVKSSATVMLSPCWFMSKVYVVSDIDENITILITTNLTVNKDEDILHVFCLLSSLKASRNCKTPAAVKREASTNLF